MRDNSLEFLVNRSFYLQKSKLVLAHIIITSQQKKIGTADFITNIVIPLRKAFAAKLCGILAIYKLLDFYWIKFNINYRIRFKVYSDCLLALSFISYQPKFIPNGSKLH